LPVSILCRPTPKQHYAYLLLCSTGQISLDEVIAAGERLPGMTALWSVATVEERRDMVMLVLKQGGLHYDVEMKEIAAITPRPVFLPVLRLLEGVVEYEEATGTLVTRRWQQRNRRASDDPQDAQRDKQTRSTAFSVSASSVFFLLTAYSRTDMRRSQHTLCGGADDDNEAIPLWTEETAGLQVLQSSVSYSLT